MCGQDWPALKAAVEIMNTYSVCDFNGQEQCIIAFKAMVLSMQPGLRYLAFHSIAHVMDWSTRWKVWRACGFDAPKCRECKFGPQPQPVVAAVAS